MGEANETNGSDVVRTVLWASNRAGFAHISRGDWEYAFSHHFEVTNPMSIDWDYFDRNFLKIYATIQPPDLMRRHHSSATACS